MLDPIQACASAIEANQHVQTLVAQRSDERLDMPIVGRLARSTEVDPHLVAVGPEIEQAPRNSLPLSTHGNFGLRPA